jgi:hypothetical protein
MVSSHSASHINPRLFETQKVITVFTRSHQLGLPEPDESSPHLSNLSF